MPPLLQTVEIVQRLGLVNPRELTERTTRTYRHLPSPELWESTSASMGQPDLSFIACWRRCASWLSRRSLATGQVAIDVHGPHAGRVRSSSWCKLLRRHPSRRLLHDHPDEIQGTRVDRLDSPNDHR